MSWSAACISLPTRTGQNKPECFNDEISKMPAGNGRHFMRCDLRAKDIIIYSDMDGTSLVDWDIGDYVPEKNIAALKRFCAEGGLFSIASGRQPADIMHYFPAGLLNAPLVCANGAIIYDPQKGKQVKSLFLPAEYKRECINYCKDHPELSVSAADTEYVYRVRTGDGRYGASSRTRAIISEEEFQVGDFVKMAFKLPKEEMLWAVERDVRAFESAAQVSIAKSADIYLDITVRDADKGKGVMTALEYMGIRRFLVCIGDNFNDISMLKIADMPVCPVSGERNVIDMCKMITCDNNTGAIANLISMLEHAVR